MKKILAVISLLLLNNLASASPGDTSIIEITATNLSSISYYQIQYAKPTRLVFSNLTTVDGSVTFHQNSNLVEVEFPLLKSCGGFFYFHGNTSLQKIVAPNLTTVTNYLYVYGNTALAVLDICNLKQILPSGNFNSAPSSVYYFVSDNNAVIDQKPLCFTAGPPTALELSSDSIFENKPVNSFIGKIKAVGNANDKFSYYLPDNLPGGAFEIRQDSLFSNIIFDYELQNSQVVKIAAVNQLGEKIEKEFDIKILDLPETGIVSIIEITDTVLPSISYHQVQFATPTKLVFTNLRSVNGPIYFHQNRNLVEVDFPMLDRCAGYFYFHENLSLEKIIAPELTTVTNYLYVYGNTGLTQLDICGLKQILPSTSNAVPSSIYYQVENNNASIDKLPLCFSTGAPTSLSISSDSIRENKAINSFIGKLSAVGATNDKISFVFSNPGGTDDDFIIRHDSLFSAVTFDYEMKNGYNINITAVNQFGEKTGKDFIIYVNDLVVEDTVTVIVNDANLASVYYHQNNFTTPTKLIFQSLTTVAGNVYFHKNTNLIAVDFPVLANAGGYFYFYQNKALQKINAPVLNTITNYLYVNGNTLLTQFNTCSLTTILPTDPLIEPYYYFSDNNNLDFSTTCFKKTNVIYVPEQIIVVKSPPNTYVGHFISDAASTDSIRFYFVDSSGRETTNDDFFIKKDSLFLTKDFQFYTGANFVFDINAIRIDRVYQRTTDIIKSLKEKINLRVNTNVLNKLSYTNRWIGLCTNPPTSAWENSGNWSSGVVPDANTDVIISSGNAVMVGTNAICRSLTVNAGANVVVKPASTITITN